MSTLKPRNGFAIIEDAVVPVEVLRCRKSDRTALVRIEGVERGIPKSNLFTTEAAAMDELGRMRATKEYAERKAEEARRLEHHPKPPELLEELDL
jgi:hypothetical protein